MTRSLKTLLSLYVICTLVAPIAAFADAESDRQRQRLEALFIWKISDELRLPVQKEQEFSSLIKELNNKRQQAKLSVDQLVEKIAANKSAKKLPSLINQYEKAHESYLMAQKAEVSEIRKLLGEQKFAQYLSLRQTLNQKLKVLLSKRKVSSQ